MPPPPIAAVLLDVGGTLWPDGWPWPADDERVRTDRLRAALPWVSAEDAVALLEDLDRRAAAPIERVEQDPRDYAGGPLRRLGIEPTADRVAAVVDAMCLPAHPLVRLFAGAPELLRALRGAGLRAVVVSNAYWRSAAAYRRDFTDLGVAGWIDAYVSSLDVGLRKPHRAMFDAGLAAAGVPAERCAMLGNSEYRDIHPAKALGLPTILVAIETPPPTSSEADAVATSLPEATSLLLSWTRPA
jgi:FMN phosphatase YigB (HAD superfamily)